MIEMSGNAIDDNDTDYEDDEMLLVFRPPGALLPP